MSGASCGKTLIPIETVTYSSVRVDLEGFLEGGTDPVHHGLGDPLRVVAPVLVAVDVGDEEEELVASLAGDDVGLPGGGVEALGHLADQAVAGAVAEGVVHELEVVDVEREHGHTAVAPARPGERAAEQLVEHRLVRAGR